MLVPFLETVRVQVENDHILTHLALRKALKEAPQQLPERVGLTSLQSKRNAMLVRIHHAIRIYGRGLHPIGQCCKMAGVSYNTFKGRAKWAKGVGYLVK